jgi:eukaryotic-like serine/threonine-protein kinase
VSVTNPAGCRRCGAPISPDEKADVCPCCRFDAEATDLVTAGRSGQVLDSLAASIGTLPRILLPDTADGATEQSPVDPSSPEMPPTAARTVRVQLLGEIARGGMGVVLKGRDPDLGRDVAVKVLLDSNKEKPDLVRRFIEEAQIGGQLQHPGVVPVYELGTFGDARPYFTMKLVKGRTLAELLADRAGAADDLPRFLGIFEQICQTMAYAHSRDVIHRDLKPSNVMVGSFGEVQVMDWGLAKVLSRGGVVDDAAAGRVKVHDTVIATARVLSDSDLSQAGSVMGTPAYMAPEQARGEGESVDRRADVFALGSILCEVLTGQPAFVGRKAGEVHRKAALGDLAEAMARLDACGEEAELILLAKECLAREPEDRPPHAGAVADRITAHLMGVQEKLRVSEIARATEQTRAEEEAKRRVLSDELAREAEARAVAARRAAELAEGRAKAERQTRRVTAALAASILGLVVVSGSGYAWFRSQRALRQSRLDLVLREAEVLRDQAAQAGDDVRRWAKAGDAARAAERLMADARDEHTRLRLVTLLESVSNSETAAIADRKLLEDLIDIRSAKADDEGGPRTDSMYSAAFQQAGLDLNVLPPYEAGAKIRARPAAVAVTFVAAIDDWAAVRRTRMGDRQGGARLAEVARAADSDAWRAGLRNALDLADQAQRLEALRGLARDAKVDELAPVSLDLLGSALLDGRDPETAERLLRHAQRRYPSDVWLNYNLARCLEKQARREEAIRYYAAARAIQPETAHELADALVQSGEWDESIAIFRGLTRLRPTVTRHALCLARALNSHGRPKEALTALEPAVTILREATRKRPSDAVDHATLGEALIEQGKFDEALSELRIAVRLGQKDAYILVGISVVLDKQGKFDEAATAAREAIETAPDEAVTHAQLATVLSHQGKLDEMIAEYRTAISLRFDVHSYHEKVAWALAQRGKELEALAEYRIALRIDRACAYSHVQLGRLLQSEGKVDESIAEYKAVIRLNPGDAFAHNSLGNALTSQGKMAEAMVEYRIGFRNQPDAVYGENEFAWMVALAPNRPPRDYDEALEHSKKALELAPNKGLYYNTLALVEYRRGRWNDSIAAATRSIAIGNGGDASDWFFLALAHWQLGEKEKARTWFDKAVAWTKEKRPKNAELFQFWKEAAKLLALPGPSEPGR